MRGKIIFFHDQVAYSHQTHEMARPTKYSDWKNDSTDSAPDKNLQKKWTKKFRAKKVKKIKSIKSSVKGTKYTYLLISGYEVRVSQYFAKWKLKAKLMETKFIYCVMHACIEFKIKINPYGHPG